MGKDKKPVRVGLVCGKYRSGGVEKVLLNYYHNLDRTKIQYDFIFDADSEDIPYKEIRRLGGRVVICPPYQQIFDYQKFMIELFSKNKYLIVHSNINTLSVFPLRAAKQAGVPVRIAHSHSTSSRSDWKKNLAKNMLRPFSTRYANVFFACSEEAGLYQFGKNATFTVINNAIDLREYKFTKTARKEIRRELHIPEDAFVIGHVGRFVRQKNHEFLIDVFSDYHKDHPEAILVLVGSGPHMEEIRRKVRMLGLTRAVRFTGVRSDVGKVYSAMDVLLLPSRYEGLGMVLVEAQANGLPCAASDRVPEEAATGGDIKFLSLSNRKEWVKYLEKHKFKRYDCTNEIRKNNYEIKTEAKKLQDMYKRLIAYSKLMDGLM